MSEWKEAYQKMMRENTQLHAKVNYLEKELVNANEHIKQCGLNFKTLHNNSMKRGLKYLINNELLNTGSDYYYEFCSEVSLMEIQKFS